MYRGLVSVVGAFEEICSSSLSAGLTALGAKLSGRKLVNCMLGFGRRTRFNGHLKSARSKIADSGVGLLGGRQHDTGLRGWTACGISDSVSALLFHQWSGDIAFEWSSHYNQESGHLSQEVSANLYQLGLHHWV